MEHKLNIEKNEKYNFIKITCTDGCYITDWNEGDDILEFAFGIEYCCPATIDLTKFRCIAKDECDRLQAMREEAEQKMREEEK